MFDENQTMSWRLVAVVSALVLSGCTKSNPAVCCTSASDCAAVGLNNIKPCADGLLCRGNQCIAETCSSSTDCDASAPFCSSGSCAASCMDDSECPGFGQDSSEAFCVSGACVACRMGMNDCPASAPVCDMGECRACVQDTECPSSVCDVDSGMCVGESSVRYADPNGVDINDCSLAAPCTPTKALSVVDGTHPWLRLLPGMYGLALPSISKAVRIVATGATIAPASASSAGLTIGSGANASVRGLVVNVQSLSNVTAILCSPQTGMAGASLRSVTAKANPSLGAALVAQNLCQLQISQSNFVGEVQFSDSSASVIDRSYFEGSWSVGTTSTTSSLQLQVLNSVMVDPVFSPSLANNTTPGALRVYLAYDTLYSSNGSFVAGCSNSAPATSTTFIDNIFYTPSGTTGLNVVSGCTADTNVVYPERVGANPGANAITQDPRILDAANSDFHLRPGSPAIDMAKPTANDPPIDLDGTTRPQGAAYDIGAYEYKP